MGEVLAKRERERVLRFGQGAGGWKVLGQRVLRSRRRCASLGRIVSIVSQRCVVPGSARSEPQVR